MSDKMVLPGATLGVLGGGQLGKMFVHAAQTMGYRTVVLDPDPGSPAGGVAHEHLRADYLNADALAQLAERADAITTEFENVPAAALRTLSARRPTAPSADAVAVCQDRAAEKACLTAAQVPCAPYVVIEHVDQLAGVPDTLLPGILKTARLGYDGKGQRTVHNRDELERAYSALGHVACVLEQRMALAFEFSVIVARSAQGDVVALPPQQNLHRGGILAVTVAPAPDVSPVLAKQALQAASSIATTLAYVGVLCVEFFVLQDGRLLANEMAPRPHNSGHYSIEACDVSQFDLQLRAMTGLSLPQPRQHSPAVMLNLLGDLWWSGGAAAPAEPPWADVLQLPGAHLHLYGKADAKPGRKMGHLTLTAATAAEARATALQAAALLGIAPY